MPHTVKTPDKRKGEILDAARQLFFSRGYAKTTITDIIESADISKGLFYYYFGSKEDVLDEIVEQVISQDVAALADIAQDGQRTVPERLIAMFHQHRAVMADSSNQVTAHLCAIQSPEIVIRVIRSGVLRLTPVFTGVVEEGVREGIFDIADPAGCVEVLLGAYTFGAVFGDVTHQEGRAEAFRNVLERALGAAPMTLACHT